MKEVTLKRDMFPDGAKFWDDDGMPIVTTPDGPPLFVGGYKVVPAGEPPNPFGPFVREVDWDGLMAIRDKYLRMAEA